MSNFLLTYYNRGMAHYDYQWFETENELQDFLKENKDEDFREYKAMEVNVVRDIEIREE